MDIKIEIKLNVDNAQFHNPYNENDGLDYIAISDVLMKNFKKLNNDIVYAGKLDGFKIKDMYGNSVGYIDITTTK